MVIVQENGANKTNNGEVDKYKINFCAQRKWYYNETSTYRPCNWTDDNDEMLAISCEYYG